MNILLIISLILAGLMGLILLIALFMRKDHFVKREIVINAPKQKVFDFLRFLDNQEKFNKHAMQGGGRKKEFKGTDGTEGFIYAWKGDKNAGEGEKEIKKIVEGERIETEIRFIKPMRATASIVMTTESLPDGKTRVGWSNSGKFPYPLNIMIPMMEKMLPNDMDSSLATLKNLLEKH